MQYDEMQPTARSDAVERWLQSLPLATLLANALPIDGRGSLDPDEALRAVSCLDSEQLERSIAVAWDGVRRVMAEGVQKLRDAYKALDERARRIDTPGGHKFGDISKMACGSLRDFHGALTERVGEPLL